MVETERGRIFGTPTWVKVSVPPKLYERVEGYEMAARRELQEEINAFATTRGWEEALSIDFTFESDARVAKCAVIAGAADEPTSAPNPQKQAGITLQDSSTGGTTYVGVRPVTPRVTVARSQLGISAATIPRLPMEFVLTPDHGVLVAGRGVALTLNGRTYRKWTQLTVMQGDTIELGSGEHRHRFEVLALNKEDLA